MSRLTSSTSALSLLQVCAVAVVGCGSPGSPTPDASTSDAGAQHCEGGGLVIASVEPGVSVTLFNPGPGDLDLTGTGWVLCQRPSYVQLEMIEAGVTLEAGASHTFAFPSAFRDQGGDTGELALYRRSAFTNAEAMVDYVCWGDGRIDNRRSVAEEAGLWSGPCASSFGTAHLARRAGSDGRTASSYIEAATPSPLMCP